MIAALVVTAALQGTGHGSELAPRTGIAGLGGFRSISRLDFGSSQNRLTAIYVFPDRTRWHFENYAAQGRSEHQFVYRLGELVTEFGSGQPSRELEEAGRDVVVLQMELRRAAMLWPDGFTWAALDGSTHTAAVYLDSCCDARPLGNLVATLADGRPRKIEARDLEGRVMETLEVQSWQEHAARTWPRTMTVHGASGRFTETIETLDTRIHYLDLAFRPPDRRGSPTAGWKPGEALPLDLIAMTYAPRDLASGTSWQAAREQARAWIAAASAELAAQGLEVDPVPTFEVGHDGLPRRCLVRLSAPAFPPPAGHETRHERLGVFIPLQAPTEVNASTLERLRRAVPVDAEPGTPYVRLHERPQLPVELVLPFEPKD
jgi:hypothetical protein